MTMDDWVLALHLLSAFALSAAMIVFWVAVVSMRRTNLPENVAAAARFLPLGGAVVIAGSLGVLVFGIWLAISLDDVQLWDGWVILAIVLWAVGSELGRRSDPEYKPAVDRARELIAAGQTGPDEKLGELARTSKGLLYHTISTVAIVLILADMVWKPGA